MDKNSNFSPIPFTYEISFAISALYYPIISDLSLVKWKSEFSIIPQLSSFFFRYWYVSNPTYQYPNKKEGDCRVRGNSDYAYISTSDNKELVLNYESGFALLLPNTVFFSNTVELLRLFVRV